MKVEIPNPNLATTLIDQWAAHAGISLGILRGRVTAEKACYELKVEGPAAEVARIVRQSAPWEASRRFLYPRLTGARA
jgi:hypothetical protein